jgi:hypothetical protein
MVVVDVLIVPIHIAATISNTPLHFVHVIFNDPCTKPPFIIPFTTTERRRLWVTLRLIVNIAMKRKILRDVVVFVIHVLKIFLMESVVYNIPPCIWIMILPTSLLLHVPLLSMY